LEAAGAVVVIVGVAADAVGRKKAEDPTKSTRRRTASFLTIVFASALFMSQWKANTIRLRTNVII
jgi:DMSO/TMAO reductase YedYZ heme-binding membrane subunit